MLAMLLALSAQAGSVAPKVTPGTPEVQGSLDKDLIRRIVRRHVRELEKCYQDGLAEDPELQGRVVLAITILSTGAVGSAVVQSTTLHNQAVEQCLAAAVKGFQFPRPAGGNVVITYPFILKPADAD